jgi:heptosyltransferase-2
VPPGPAARSIAGRLPHPAVPVISTALIIKLAAIGDVVMALPMVTALRAANPAVRVTWMTGRAVMPLLRCVDGIDEIIEADELAILAGTPRAQARAVLDAWRALGRRRFDQVLLAHNDRRYRLLPRWVRSGETRWLGERRNRPRFVPFRRHEDEYVRLVTGVDDAAARRFAPPAFVATLDAGVEAVLRSLAGRRLIALAPGSARNNARDNPLRRWPLPHYADLARVLLARGDAVLLTGDDGDAWTRDAFAGLAVTDLIGKTTLPGLVALYARCAAVVAHDSGPFHLARLAGTRVVGLFGPTSPWAFVRDDVLTAAVWRAGSLACAPCYDGRDFARCSDNRCMQMIEPRTVLARLDALLAVSA